GRQAIGNGQAGNVKAVAADLPDQGGDDRGPSESALRRMARAGRDVRQARAMSLAEALRVTLAKVASDPFGTAMAVIGVRSETRNGDDLEGVFGAQTLLMLLDGPHRRRAAAVFDAAL